MEIEDPFLAGKNKKLGAGGGWFLDLSLVFAASTSVIFPRKRPSDAWCTASCAASPCSNTHKHQSRINQSTKDAGQQRPHLHRVEGSLVVALAI